MAAKARRLLYSWGNGDFGRLGLGPNFSNQTLPTLCETLLGSTVTNVECGGAHTVALTDSGEVWTFGLNSHGQLGHSEGHSHRGDPWLAQIPEKVTSVAAGHAHTLCLGESGSVWSFGSNQEGQLGQGATDAQCTPRKLEGLSGIDVAAGAAHSLVATNSGEVFSWGRGEYGQLGHDPKTQGLFGKLSLPEEMFPRLVRDLRIFDIVSIYAGHDHSGAIDREGRVFTWGLNRGVQLGHGDDNCDLSPFPKQVGEVSGAAGLSLGGNHSLAVRHGFAYAWGLNDCGILGISNLERATKPALLSNLAAAQVSAGWKHSAGVTPNGQLFVWGSGGSVGHPSGIYEIGRFGAGGQLGLGDDHDRMEPTQVTLENPNSSFVQVSCGFNHTAAVVAESLAN